MFLVALVAVLVSGCVDGSKPVAGPGAAPVRFTVPEGASVAKVATALEKQGVVRSAGYLKKLSKGKIQPGLYALSPSDTPEVILQKLEKGEVMATKVTLPEGYTLKKIAARLKEKGVIPDAEAFITLATEPENLEGYLFPDTYFFPPDIEPKAVLAQLRANLDKRVGSLANWKVKSKREILTVASLIEREAETDADRAKIAGVIYNRIARKMRLQIDATVQYALPEHKARLTFADLKIDSPYNTYTIEGLPPGPICSPGLASIQAALHPEKSEFLYYVQGTDKGHLFAKTFAEHKANIARVRGKHG